MLGQRHVGARRHGEACELPAPVPVREGHPVVFAGVQPLGLDGLVGVVFLLGFKDRLTSGVEVLNGLQPRILGGHDFRLKDQLCVVHVVSQQRHLLV